MTRSAFRGTLELSNNQAATSLNQVGFDLNIRDGDGNDARDLFNVQVTRLTGMSAIDGSGQIGPQSNGSAQWTLIPRDSAAPLADTIYTIGGTIRYDQGGTLFSIPVTPVSITVRPDAALHLKYFHQRDVFSDDPHTDEVEPAVPYSLAVMVENRGAGTARNLSITSAQPEIVDNEKGLLIDFQVTGTEVDGQNLSPSLTANFGNVDPGERKIACWLMTSSLQGLFIDYDATFQHLDGFDDKRLSLIKEVGIHEMIRMIEDPAGNPAFLVNDIADIRDLPDTVHLSDGTTTPVAVHETADFSDPVNLQTLSVVMTAPAGTGWSYLRVPDPGEGRFALTGVTRSDGKVIPLDKNAWTTDRTFIGLGQRPIYENILHLADLDSTGSYTLIYAARPDADTTPPESRVEDLAAQIGPAIPVRWSGSDDGGIARYDIYVSIDGGPWQIWLEGTTASSAIYPGEAGSSYAFYSVAIDRAGNVQNRTASADASTEVSLINLPPVIQSVPEQFIPEGSSFALTIQAADPDGPSEALAYSLASPVPGITINSQGVVRWVTAEGDGGTQVDVTVSVTDGGVPQAAASITIRLIVVETNSPPVIAAIGPQSITAEETLSVQVAATDRDIPAQTITFSLASGSPAGMTIDPLGGLITWTPTREASGRSHYVGVIADDSGISSSSSMTEFAVSVLEPPNRPPVFNPIPPSLWLQLPANSPVQFRSQTVRATDPDGDSVTIAADLSGLPVDGTALPFFEPIPGAGLGRFSWDSRGVAPGTYFVPLTASDGISQTLASLAIRLAPNNEYWGWALTNLSGVSNVGDYEMMADPDGDGTANVFEMALLRNPLRADHTPLTITPVAIAEAGFRVFDLDFKQHRDAGKFVNLLPAKSDGLSEWNALATGEWNSFTDPLGDTDGRADTQDIRWRIFAPAGETRMFYRIEGTRKAE